MPDRYLIDANVVFQAKELWYKFTYALPFWKWLEDGHDGSQFYSIKKVRGEILNGNATCPVKKWVQTALPGAFFLEDETVPKVRTYYGELMQWATAQHAKGVYTFPALQEFAAQKRADAWLIAAAQQYNCTIVTHETASGGSHNLGKIKIPNAAAAVGVKTTTLFQLLDKYAGAAFSYEAPPL